MHDAAHLVGIAGVLSLGAALHGKGVRFWSGLRASAAAIGSGFSLRQLWLQSLPPDEVPACGPGLSYMIEVFLLSEVIEAMVFGTELRRSVLDTRRYLNSGLGIHRLRRLLRRHRADLARASGPR